MPPDEVEMVICFHYPAFKAFSQTKSKNRGLLWRAAGALLINVFQKASAELVIGFPKEPGTPFWKAAVKCVLNQYLVIQWTEDKA